MSCGCVFEVDDGACAVCDCVYRFAGGALADVESGGGRCVGGAGAQDFFGFEEEAVVVVAAAGEEFAVGRPCKSADLLGVDCHAGEEGHGAVPAEECALVFGWPFDAVEVDVTYFIAYEELFRGHTQGWISE